MKTLLCIMNLSPEYQTRSESQARGQSGGTMRVTSRLGNITAPSRPPQRAVRASVRPPLLATPVILLDQPYPLLITVESGVFCQRRESCEPPQVQANPPSSEQVLPIARVRLSGFPDSPATPAGRSRFLAQPEDPGRHAHPRPPGVHPEMNSPIPGCAQLSRAYRGFGA